MKNFISTLISLLIFTSISYGQPSPTPVVPLKILQSGTLLGYADTFNCSTNVTCSIAGGVVTATASGSGGGSDYYTWNSISSSTQTLVTANGYINTNAGLTTYTLPTSPSIGHHYYLVGKSSGGWKLAQLASQTVYIGNTHTTTGVSGSLASTNARDGIEILCVASNEFEVTTIIGNITVV